MLTPAGVRPANLWGEYCQVAADNARVAPRVAVRSSAVDEDGPPAWLAGQHQTFLNVVGVDAVAQAFCTLLGLGALRGCASLSPLVGVAARPTDGSTNLAACTG